MQSKPNTVESIKLANPENSLFYQESNIAFGASLVKAIYPAHNTSNQSDGTFALHNHGTASPKNNAINSKEEFNSNYHILVFGGNLIIAAGTLDSNICNVAKNTGAYIICCKTQK